MPKLITSFCQQHTLNLGEKRARNSRELIIFSYIMEFWERGKEHVFDDDITWAKLQKTWGSSETLYL
jgi:hypothetical protein